MFIQRGTIKALNKTSLSDAMDEFFQAAGARPRHLLISNPYQDFGEELALGENILLQFIPALPLGSWMLCSDDAIYIGGEQHGKHTIIMWKD